MMSRELAQRLYGIIYGYFWLAIAEATVKRHHETLKKTGMMGDGVKNKEQLFWR